ncbi:origin recognition complex subunit [Massarina eburnea CBS 473.64]|uniref:Origin recognition complex subunit n=1 Tax=Massarina eburnea CBS 473.64 TaxID=1395130 RepID=A0A6A6RIU3_9PLEO|nr:origin recognition complex subunit [Massarina eburnea CBS 473.64]
MEHERCYIYTPPEAEERPSKRQRTSDFNPQSQLAERLSTYRKIWAQQEQRIQATLEEADSKTQEKIVNFVSASAPVENAPQTSIPTGLVVAGPSIASHGPFFARLGRSIRDETNSAYVVLTSAESPNLKTLLKNLIKRVTSRIEEDDDDDIRPTASSRHGPKVLDFDLSHVQEWQKKNRTRSIVVALQDSEAFDTRILIELVDLFHCWLDRLPFVLLVGIATSTESFEDRLSGKSIRYLDGQKFDVTQSDVIIEKLFSATVANTDVPVRIGPDLSRRLLDRQKDHVQNVHDFIDGLKYAYMSHFYASYPTVLLKEKVAFKDLSSEAFEAVRNLPSFKRWVEELLDNNQAHDVRKLLESDQYLYQQVTEHIESGQNALNTLSNAATLLTCIRESLQMAPSIRLSNIWTRAAAGELSGAPLLRETLLSVKKASSDKLAPLFASLKELDIDTSPLDQDIFQKELEKLVEDNVGSGPLRSQDDVRNDSLRTTVIAQKVLLSKHKAALSEQDKAYSSLVARFNDGLERYFASAFIDPRTLFLSEILMYDLKSPHTEVFQPKPRFAMERALASPHDYLGCDCCSGKQGGESILSTTQPATAILYQLYLESGTLINVSDLWSAFNAIAGDDEDESKTM